MRSLRREQEESEVAFEDIGPGMSDHAGSQVAAPRDERAIQDSERRDDDDLFPTLVRMREAKNYAL